MDHQNNLVYSIENYIYFNQSIAKASLGHYHLGWEQEVMNSEVIIKKIQKSEWEVYFKDIEALKNLIKEQKNNRLHEHLPKIIKYFSCKSENIYVIMQMHTTKTLLDVIKSSFISNRISLVHAKLYIYQIYKALKHLSFSCSKDVNQIPLNSIIIDESNLQAMLDFVPDTLLKKDRNYYMYTAPEALLNKPCGYKGWIWCLGMIFYRIICGIDPWKSTNYDDYLQEIKMNNFDFPIDCAIGEDEIGLINKMLIYNPEKRIGTKELEKYFNDQEFAEPPPIESLFLITRKIHNSAYCSSCSEPIKGLRYISEDKNLCRECFEVDNCLPNYYGLFYEIDTPINRLIPNHNKLIIEYIKNVYKNKISFKCTTCYQEKPDHPPIINKYNHNRTLCLSCSNELLKSRKSTIDRILYTQPEKSLLFLKITNEPSNNLKSMSTSNTYPTSISITDKNEGISISSLKIFDLYEEELNKKIGQIFETYKFLSSNNIPLIKSCLKKKITDKTFYIELSFDCSCFIKLSDAVKENMPILLKLHLFMQIIWTIRWMHRHKYLHKYITPDLILVDKESNISLVGFEYSILEKNINKPIMFNENYDDPIKKIPNTNFDIDVDIYSIGKLCDWIFNVKKSNDDNNRYFNDLINKCLDPIRAFRISTEEIYEIIYDCIEYITKNTGCKIENLLLNGIYNKKANSILEKLLRNL